VNGLTSLKGVIESDGRSAALSKSAGLSAGASTEGAPSAIAAIVVQCKIRKSV